MARVQTKQSLCNTLCQYEGGIPALFKNPKVKTGLLTVFIAYLVSRVGKIYKRHIAESRVKCTVVRGEVVIEWVQMQCSGRRALCMHRVSTIHRCTCMA